MAFDEDIKQAIMDVDPSAPISLYNLELKDKNGSSIGFYKFHGGENGYKHNIRYGGTSSNKDEYLYVPLSASGFDYVDETLPRPTLRFDNSDSYFSLRSNHFDNFTGFKIVRIKTFVRFLDGSNFPNGVNPFGSGNESSYPQEAYIINKKNVENTQTIEFELVSAFEKEGGLIPARKIVYNVCQWKYRSEHGCGYGGAPVADESNNTNQFTNLNNQGAYLDTRTYAVRDYVFIDNGTAEKKFFVCTSSTTAGESPITHPKKWVKDACSKNLKGCRLRFSNTELNRGLPFGGFPGSWPA